MDNVQLEFVDEALVAIAQEALKRNTGARGLRAIIESIMRNVMYDIPSRTDVVKCIVTKEVVVNKEEPMLVTIDRKTKKKEESA
jgi:ATP-dependent Clp protease ATP-binding subunit ClpX